MGRYGIEDINDPRIVDMMEARINRSDHWREWKRVAEAKGRPLTADDIESILRDVESQPTISNAVVFRTEGSI
jgi:predicted Ser/Thr protein kinase